MQATSENHPVHKVLHANLRAERRFERIVSSVFTIATFGTGKNLLF